MEPTVTIPSVSAHNFESRKLQLLARIARTEDEELIAYLEEILIEEGSAATDEEIAIVEARIAAFQANPDDFVTLETFIQQSAPER